MEDFWELTSMFGDMFSPKDICRWWSNRTMKIFSIFSNHLFNDIAFATSNSVSHNSVAKILLQWLKQNGKHRVPFTCSLCTFRQTFSIFLSKDFVCNTTSHPRCCHTVFLCPTLCSNHLQHHLVTGKWQYLARNKQESLQMEKVVGKSVARLENLLLSLGIHLM